ncbi:MAG: ComEC/Rec2 family competence protein, partial [Saezia sp.]
AWVIYGLVGWLWRRSVKLMLHIPAHTAAMVAGLLCACLYAWFAGWGVPAQRTVMMLATVVLLRFAGIRWPWYVVWLFVAVVIVTIDPWALLQAGFWLSFVAVGVLFAQSSQYAENSAEQELEKELKRLQQMLLRPWWQQLLRKFWESVRTLLLVQLRISIVLAPLTLLLFQQMSVVGLVVNMIAIPWVTFLMVPLSLLGMIAHPLWHLTAWAGSILLRVLDWFASLPGAVVYSAMPPLPVAILAMLGALLLVLPRFKWQLRCLGVLLLVPVFIWQPQKPSQGEFEALFLDVGQGSSVLIRTANHALLYDAGPKYSEESDAGAILVVPTLRALGISLDKIVISHEDSDHAGGLASVWSNHPRADLLYSMKDA